jgi:hypothetical protein
MCDREDKIVYCSFLPATPDCLLVVGSQSSFIYLLKEVVTIPFLAVPKVQFIGLTSARGDRAVVVRADTVELFDIGSERRPVSSRSLAAAVLSSHAEIELFDFRNDTLAVITRNRWLTIISIYRDRLFVSKRVRLLNSAPVDWSFIHEHIALTTKDGFVLITGQHVQLSPRKPLPSTPRVASVPLPTPPTLQPRSPPSHARPPIIPPPITVGQRSSAIAKRVLTPDPIALPPPDVLFPKGQSTPSFVALEYIKSPLNHLVPLSDDEVFSALRPLVRIPRQNSARPRMPNRFGEPNVREPPIRSRRRLSDNHGSPNPDVVEALAVISRANTPKEAEPSPPRQRSTQKSSFGIPADIHFAFRLTDIPLHHVEWVSGARLVSWSSYRGRNVIFLVDLKERVVQHLLPEIPGLAITDVVFSADRLWLCVIANRSLTSFFRLSPVVKRVAVFSFGGPVAVDFRPGPGSAIVVTESGVMTTIVDLASSDGPPRRKNVTITLPLRTRDPVVAVALRGSTVTVATTTGAIIQIDLSSSPPAFKDARQLKSGFASMRPCPRGGLAVFDDKGHGVFQLANGEWSSLPCAVKAAALCTPIAFLVRMRGSHYLRVVQIVGQFMHTPSNIVSQCSVLKSRDQLEAIVASAPRTPAVCLEIGMPLAMKALQARTAGDWIRQHLLVLRNLFARDSRLLARSARYSYVLRDFEGARQLFLATLPDDENFITNIMKAIAIGSTGGEALHGAASELLTRGLADEAMDLLLMTDNWDAAASNLIALGMLAEAALVLLAQDHSDVRTQLVERLAVRMLFAGAAACSVVILSAIGDFGEIEERFIQAAENAQAQFVSTLTSK